MMIDSHAHLDMIEFEPDRDAVIQRARKAGVGTILTIATHKPGDASVQKTLEMVEGQTGLLAGVGVHPHDARYADEDCFRQMESWAKHPKVVLWGEIGLDYYYDHSPRDVQREVFIRQLELARRHSLPVSIHCRDAWSDMIEILRQMPAADSPGILHSFTGSSEQVRDCIDLGYFISLSGIVTFKKAAELRKTVKSVPLDRLLVETDAPFLAPEPYRGRRNEPAFVVEVARSLAQTLALDFEEVAERTSRNFSILTGQDEAGSRS